MFLIHLKETTLDKILFEVTDEHYSYPCEQKLNHDLAINAQVDQATKELTKRCNDYNSYYGIPSDILRSPDAIAWDHDISGEKFHTRYELIIEGGLPYKELYGHSFICFVCAGTLNFFPPINGEIKLSYTTVGNPNQVYSRSSVTGVLVISTEGDSFLYLRHGSSTPSQIRRIGAR
jgi:hypothetical protein